MPVLKNQQERGWGVENQTGVVSKVYAYTKQDTYEAKQKLYEIKELLGDRSFARINKALEEK